MFAILATYLLSVINLYIAEKYNAKLNYWASGYTAGITTAMLLWYLKY